MTDILLLIQTSDGKEIRLTRTQWKHISYRHPEMAGRFSDIKDAITKPTSIRQHSNDIVKFYRFIKAKKKYIMVAVKTLDHKGFIVTV